MPHPAGQRPMSPVDPDITAQQALIGDLKAGSVAAFEALFRAEYEALVRFAFAFLKSRAKAEELVQEVFFTLWSQRERWSIRDSVRGYLFAATRNQALNLLRRGNLEQRWVTGAEASTGGDFLLARTAPTDEATVTAELGSAIQAAVDRLPGRCRETYLLSRQHQMSYEEIAQTMGVSVRTVQEQLGRALRALRAQLADWLE